METRKKTSVWGLVIVLALVVLDQLTKYLAESFLAGQRGSFLIPEIFQLYYLQNRGAAFGVLSGRQWIFVVMAVLMIVLGIYTYLHLPDGKHYSVMRMVCVLIVAGALGNMIDRVVHGYVIDFLYFSLIDFPVFNVADCYVCIGAAMLVLSLFTVYREDEFHFLLPGEPSGK
jgi:signal peptidase II